MKKIFTLIAGLLMAAAVFAADHRPSVMVRSSKNYKIVIDGRSFFTNSNTIRLDNFYVGRHTIKVYEMRRGYFGRRERLVDAAAFEVRRNDVMINVDFFGNISIRERRSYGRYDRDERGYDRNERDDRRDWDDEHDRRNWDNDQDRRDWGRNDNDNRF